MLYSKTQNSDSYNAIDTSSVASTVRLFAESGNKQIKLSWNAVVPWSNVVDVNPWHRIYRGVFRDDDSELELIDSVNVSEAGFEYIDIGRFMNSPLQDDVFYTYAIQTRGTYGNPLIPHLLNRSQMVSIYPVNDLPPCIPVVEVDKTDCTEFLKSASCTPDDFFNSLQWTIPDESGCRKDLVSFNIYGLGPGEVEYTLLANITGNSFKDEHLVNFAKCYRIEGVDAAGKVSELSDPTCNDNCPAFYFTNILLQMAMDA